MRWTLTPAAVLVACAVGAQEPLPGPGIIVGTVRDVAGNPVPNAEIAVGSTGPRVLTSATGGFRIEKVSPGTHTLRARRIGFRAESKTVKLADSGAVAAFTLTPLPNVLPAVVSSARRGGISGVVQDSTGRPVPNARVEALGSGRGQVRSDSNGAFFLDARQGKFMLSVARNSFLTRLISVTVPADSGRHVVVGLNHAAKGATSRHAVEIFELRQRLVRATGPTVMRLWTREDLDKLGPHRDVAQLASFGTVKRVDRDRCLATINGVPQEVLPLWAVDLAEAELLEIYPGGSCPVVIVWPRR